MNAHLQLNAIEKNHQKVKALDSVSLKLKEGKIFVLLGINGSGKTTLLRIAAGLDEPDKGSILFNDERIQARELRKIATLVFQKAVMFNTSVYDNLAFGLRIRGISEQEISEKVSAALSSVGLVDFEKRKAKKTSGGEQQRIALARAFLLEPRILLLDEPTANLDPNNAMIIENAIRTRRKEKGTIIVMATHNLNQAKRVADEIIHIYNGRILETASTKEFFNHPRNEMSRKFINGELQF